MSQFEANQPLPEEQPADPTTQVKLRRSLLFLALAILLASCGLCWYSTRVQAIETLLIPGLLGIIILFYTLYTFYQREQKQDLAPPLWRVGLVLGTILVLIILALVWMRSSLGWHPVSGPVILALGAWALFLSGRRVWEAWSFLQRSVEEENNLAEIKMISIAGSHPIHPQLAYRYAEKYRGQIESNRIRNKTPEIIQAIADGKFLVKVKYLPENPRVHRLLGWKILP